MELVKKTSRGVYLNMNHRSSDVQYETDLQTERDKQNGRGLFWLRDIQFSLESTLLKSTSFVDELQS